MEVQIVITGDKAVQRKLKKLGQSILLMPDGMKQIGEDLSRYYGNEAFLSQGGVFGKPWSPLRSGYAARKAKNYPGRPPLVKTGTMKRNFQWKAGSDYVRIYNPTSYFKYHQSTEPRSKIPRRAMMGVNSAVKKRVKDIISKEVSKKIKAA